MEEWAAWGAAHEDILPFVAVSAGTSEDDFNKVAAVLKVVNVPFICLDVANGYSEYVSAMCLRMFCSIQYFRTFGLCNDISPHVLNLVVFI